ncbi:chalcone isomerase family protein [Singulisphaera sp. Ch08]|uniref:Chalcone isomerase family protein n=1 Tax=Singulisphaera sp. Ch08 TaxID=3120278 RepID=A0AAU7CHS1_9BACT
MMICRNGFLVAILLGVCGLSEAAEPGITVGRTRYPSSIKSHVGGRPVTMVLTGAAMRTKYTFKVYSIASYVQEKTAVRNASELVSADVPKQLCLSFERDVDGDALSDSFRDSIGMIRPAPAFAADLAKLTHYMKSHPVKTGSRIWLSYIPGVGLGCQVAGAPELRLPNVALAQTVWEVYLGRKNLGVAIQSGLTSHLSR